jgi:outer membrane receptor for ferrienterochelin and colicin
MKVKLSLLAFLVLFLVSLPQKALAGTSGTLAGYVIDKESETPLPGVNVIIKGTHLGAATNAKGFFMIINVPPGVYNVEAQMIGYNSMVQQSVKVLADLRTTIRFLLTEKVLAGKEVVVTAERPLIQRDVTATAHFITPEELAILPVKTIQEVVDLQPGVAAGHIRGGRKTEVLYLVDGIPIQEVIEGEVGSDLPNSAIVDMTVQTGGFNAEYGNAMSGVVNIITKEGQNKTEFRAEISGLNLSGEPAPFGERALPMDYMYEFNLGGPIIPEKLSYFISGNYLAPHSQWRREQFGTRMLVFNDDQSYNYNIVGKLAFSPFKNFKFHLSGLYSDWDWTEYDHKWKLNLIGLPPRSKKSYRGSFRLTHTLSKRLYYTLSVSQYAVLKSIYGKSSHDQKEVKYELDENGMPDYAGYVVYGDYPWWMDHEERHSTGKIEIVHQGTDNHQFKLGGEFVYFELYKKNVYRKELPAWGPGFPRYYSYDTDYTYYPNRGAIYFQDKIEYEGMVANLGWRYDWFDPTASRPAVEQRLIDEQTSWIVEHDESVKAAVKHQFSPRIGVGLPVTKTSEFRMNYGYFFQMPLFDYLYTNTNLNVAEGFSPLGDPDLKPAKTIAYELGYKVQFAENYLLDATIFNKDVTNLIDSNTFLNAADNQRGPLSGIIRYVNMAYVNIQGCELFLKKRPGSFFSGKVSYTFMLAKGTGSGETEQFDWLLAGYKVPLDEYYLSWDQRHTVVVNLDFRRHQSWGANLLWRWNSPLPYTREDGIETRPNAERMQETSYLDIRLDKSWVYKDLKLLLYGEFLNIFDAANILWVDSEGNPGGILQDPGALDSGRRFRLGLGMSYR